MPTDPNHSSEEDRRQRRKDDVRDVLAGARIAGLTVSGATETLLEAAADGEIDEAELIARVRTLHGLP
jgi:Antitoxin VbhA